MCEERSASFGERSKRSAAMTKDKAVEGCVSKAAGPIQPTHAQSSEAPSSNGKETAMHTTVGMEAPDFEASAYYEGTFKNLKLSDFRGKWVFLCFYPGDFTFV